MQFTEDQLKLAERLLEQVSGTDADYRDWGHQDILVARNECANAGMELTPQEMEEVVDLLSYIQEKLTDNL